MTAKQDAAAVEATVAQRVWRDGFGKMAGLVAGCFPWPLGHDGPHRLQHFLARAVWDHDAVRDRAARWVAHQLADDQAVLVVDETGDEKSSTDAAGAARQYSGALGGVGLCQVAVHLTYASRSGQGPHRPGPCA